MKKIIFLVNLLIAFNAYSQNSIIIDGEEKRVNMMSKLSELYLENQGKTFEVKKAYSAGHNDPSGKTLGTTNGTWVKVTHPYSGTTRVIQISNSMLSKIQGIMADATSSISLNDLCSVQSKSLREILDLVSTKQIASNDCNCEPKVIYVNNTPNEQVNVNDFETTTNSCDQVKNEITKLERIYSADKETIQAYGYQNKHAVAQAMKVLAIENPSCPYVATKIQKRGNTWVWVGAAVGTILLADVIEGNGINLFGLIKKSSPSNNLGAITHTEPTGTGSNNGGGTVITHTGTSGRSTAAVNSGFGQISGRR